MYAHEIDENHEQNSESIETTHEDTCANDVLTRGGLSKKLLI